MTTFPRYPPDGSMPRCPVCDAPYQTCTHHTEGIPAPPPEHIIDVRFSRRVPNPFFRPRTRGPVIRSQALTGPPQQGRSS